MAKKLTVVISQGQSANPAKRGLEESLVAALLFEKGVDVTVVPHLYDLAPGGTGLLCLSGIPGDMLVLSWLFPRAARWTLARNGILGHEGTTLLKGEESDEEDEDEEGETTKEEPASKGIGVPQVPNRRIYCVDLRTSDKPEPYVAEIRRIVGEVNVQTFSLMSWIQGSPKPEQLERYLAPEKPAEAAPSLPIVPAAGDAAAVTRIEEATGRRWYPVIDYSRCTNCLECLDFCLFGVYGVNKADSILVEQPDNCKKGCPACSRVCPENAIIFPQHKTPAIAGSPTEGPGGLKIDLSQLFGAPSAIEVAAMERDTELVADGREAVGLTVGIPKRQSGKKDEPRDDLDDLVDQLDNLEI
jgi:NAD-dependent dihydropyrimidine dehydrogenase PreA subunit